MLRVERTLATMEDSYLYLPLKSAMRAVNPVQRLRELRARLGDATPTLIALTGYGQPQDQRRSEEAGFSLHLVKPIQAETLMNILAAPIGQ